MIVSKLKVIVLPAALVSVIGPFTVELVAENVVTAVDISAVQVAVVEASASEDTPRLVLKLAVVPDNKSAPAPAIVPAFWLNDPPETLKFCPLGMTIEPVLVKLGVVPNWLNDRAALTLIVPSLLCCAEALLIVRT